MTKIYQIFFHQPILNLLVFFYNTVAFGDLGLAIIFVTVVVRLILYPVFQVGVRHQAVMQELQPKLKKIQEDHKTDKEKQVAATLALYREHKFNPLAPLLLLVIQLPVMIALYQIILGTLKAGSVSGLYSFIESPESFHAQFLGLINLFDKNILITGLASIAQYFQGKLALQAAHAGGDGQPKTARDMSRAMVVAGPMISLFILSQLPAAVGLYWLTSTLFSLGQQAVFQKRRTHHGKSRDVRQKNN